MKFQKDTAGSRAVSTLVKLEVDTAKEGQLLLERSLWTDVRTRGFREKTAFELIPSIALVLQLDVAAYRVTSKTRQLALVLLPQGTPPPDLLAAVALTKIFGWRLQT